MALNINDSRAPGAGGTAPGGAAVTLSYDRGSVLLSGPRSVSLESAAAYLKWDARVGAHRSLAIHYRALVRELVRREVPYRDETPRYPQLELDGASLPEPYPYQREALTAWSRGKRGTVELPTGSGKTQLALRAILAVGRGTLVLVPTLDLVSQWCAALEGAFGVVPGAIGGGSFEVQPLTVCTYASAHRHAA